MRVGWTSGDDGTWGLIEHLGMVERGGWYNIRGWWTGCV